MPSNSNEPNRSQNTGDDEICTHGSSIKVAQTPSSMPIYHAAVYSCESPEEADALLAGNEQGYVYQRDGHPNADAFAEKIALLHAANHATITSSGMSSLALAAIACLKHGDHLLVSERLYGRSQKLFLKELPRLGITCSQANFLDLKSIEDAITSGTRMLVVETISNPMLHVADIESISKIAHRANAILLVDNTFASPVVCKPLELGADLVMESVSKMINGHSDVMLGALAGNESEHLQWKRIKEVCSSWGFTSSPFECWLSLRGVATLPLRMRQASQSASFLAEFLANHPAVENVSYPSDCEIAKKQFQTFSETKSEPFEGKKPLSTKPSRTIYGNMVSFKLRKGTSERSMSESFIRNLSSIPFLPSLGDVCTSVSHPRSTSHRHMSVEESAAMGIFDETVRVSVGLESPDFIVESFRKSLKALD